MAKQPKLTEVSKQLNYIRAYQQNANIENYLGVTADTIRKIAQNKSASTKDTRERIDKLYVDTQKQVKARQEMLYATANDKRKNQNSRSLARDLARELDKKQFTYAEAQKRQVIVKEQAARDKARRKPLPFIMASEFLSHYSEGKTEIQIEKERKRFSPGGVESYVTNIDGNVLFSSRPLYLDSLVHPRFVVYVNAFERGIKQIVRDNNQIYDNNQSLNSAIEEGLFYFNTMFRGADHLNVNEKAMDRGHERPKHGRSMTKGEKYQDMMNSLAQRIFLGVFLY